MEAKLAPETSAALKTDTTIRFFYRVKFKLDSRRSGPVIAWAESRANAAVCAILKQVGREAASVKVQMLDVHLLRVRKYAYLCFDLCLGKEEDDCTEKPAVVRLRRPIHEIAKRGNAYVVWRSGRLDARIAAELASRQELDKGPLPYFVDTMHPPMYVSGVRLEGPMDPDLKDESEEEEEDKSEKENKSEEEQKSGEEHKLEDTNTPSKAEEMVDEEDKSEKENKSEEEHKLEDTNTPSKVEEMVDEQMRGKLEVDRPK